MIDINSNRYLLLTELEVIPYVQYIRLQMVPRLQEEGSVPHAICQNNYLRELTFKKLACFKCFMYASHDFSEECDRS